MSDNLPNPRLSADLAGRPVKYTSDGLPYIMYDWGRYVRPTYVSPCCGAFVTYSQDDGALCCKNCWRDVDPSLGGDVVGIVASVVMLEARCECGETFIPADESDTTHVERADGTPCGLTGEITGEYRS